MTVKTPTRKSRIEARLAPDVLAMVKRAAALEGRTVSDFVVTAAQEAAKRAITERDIIRFSLEGQRVFADAIVNPRAVPKGFRKAVARHRQLIRDVR